MERTDFMYLLEAAQSAFDFSTLDLSSLMPTFVAAVTATIGVTISILAVKKGIAWLIGAIKRA